MRDRELLELAAKAAGGQVRFDLSPDGAPWLQSVVAGKPQPYPVRWNQLTDDGDALRLMVRLAMTVRQEPSSVAAGWGVDCFGAPTLDRRGPWFWVEWFSDNKDRFAATRRAIARAAAQTGKAMP